VVCHRLALLWVEIVERLHRHDRGFDVGASQPTPTAAPFVPGGHDTAVEVRKLEMPDRQTLLVWA
jgi:hypothetical protein